MKTADEMFKELGFEKVLHTNSIIRYICEKKHNLLEIEIKSKSYYLLNKNYLYMKISRRLEKAITKNNERGYYGRKNYYYS